MKKSLIVGAFVLGAACALVATSARSQDAGHEFPEMTPQARALVEAMAKSKADPMSTNVFHEKLAVMEGDWKTTMRTWMGGPDAPPMVSPGRSTIRRVLDGRYLLEEMETTFRFPDGQGGFMEIPHKGMGLTGYDNFRNQYVATWVDNMTTQMLTMAGNVDPGGTVFTSYGTMDEPAIHVTGRMVKYRTVVESADRFVMTITDLHAGDDYKVIEIAYERQ